MKKILCALLMVTILCCACSSIPSSQSDNTDKIALVMYAGDRSISDELFIQGYLSACQKSGVDGGILIYDHKNVTELLDGRQLDGLIYGASNIYPSKNPPRLKQVLCINADASYMDQEQKDATMVVENYTEMGQLAAQFMMDQLTACGITQGQIVLPVQYGPVEATLFQKGFEDQLDKQQSQLMVFELFVPNDSYEKMISDMVEKVKEESDIVGFATPWCEQAQLYATVAEQLQLSNPLIIGGMLSENTVDLLEAGRIDAVIASSPYKHGYLCVERLKKMMDGETVTPKNFRTYVPTEVWTIDNLHELKTLYARIDELK